MKKLAKTGIGLTLLLSLVACGNETDTTEEVETVEPTEQVETVEEVEEVETTKVESVDTVETEYESDYDNGSEESNTILEDYALITLQESMYGQADIHFFKPEQTFIIVPTDESLIHAINMYGVFGENAQEWNTVVESIVSLSDTYVDTLGTGYTIIIANPNNLDNVLLKVKDGEVLFTI